MSKIVPTSVFPSLPHLDVRSAFSNVTQRAATRVKQAAKATAETIGRKLGLYTPALIEQYPHLGATYTESSQMKKLSYMFGQICTGTPTDLRQLPLPHMDIRSIRNPISQEFMEVNFNSIFDPLYTSSTKEFDMLIPYLLAKNSAIHKPFEHGSNINDMIHHLHQDVAITCRSEKIDTVGKTSLAAAGVAAGTALVATGVGAPLGVAVGLLSAEVLASTYSTVGGIYTGIEQLMGGFKDLYNTDALRSECNYLKHIKSRVDSVDEHDPQRLLKLVLAMIPYYYLVTTRGHGHFTKAFLLYVSHYDIKKSNAQKHKMNRLKFYEICKTLSGFYTDLELQQDRESLASKKIVDRIHEFATRQHSFYSYERISFKNELTADELLELHQEEQHEIDDSLQMWQGIALHQSAEEQHLDADIQELFRSIATGIQNIEDLRIRHAQELAQTHQGHLQKERRLFDELSSKPVPKLTRQHSMGGRRRTKKCYK
jgi:hypothetical protein